MANQSKLTKDTEILYLQFLEMGLPSRIVAEAMDINPATADKYMKKLGKKDFEIAKGRLAGQLRMLELYSSWIANPGEFALIAGGTKKDLLKILWNELDMESLLVYLMGILTTLNSLGRPSFEGGIPQNEQDFINDLFFSSYGTPTRPVRGRAKEWIHNIMTDLHNGVIPFPSIEQFSERMKCFSSFAFSFIEKEKDRTAPFITLKARDTLKQLMLERKLSEKECSVIECQFGLGWVPFEESSIAELKPERKHQIKSQAFRKLLHFDRFGIFICSLYNHSDTSANLEKKFSELTQSLNDLRSRHASLASVSEEQQKQIAFLRTKAVLTDDERTKLGEKFDSTTFANGIRLEILRMPVEDLGLSVRAFNCLRAAKINFFWEIAKITLEELLKFRNFGKKSLIEIEALLLEKNLKFGTPFSLQEQEILYNLCYRPK